MLFERGPLAYFFLSRSCNFFCCFQSFGGIYTDNTGFGFKARDTRRRHSSDGYDYAAAAEVAVSKTTTETPFNLKAPKLLPLLLLLYYASTLNYHAIRNYDYNTVLR